MMRFLIIIFLLLTLTNLGKTDIVDKLTKLNNLYKDGALNEKEFKKAKKILLKDNPQENKITENKPIIEIKKTNFNKFDKDLSQTFIRKDELEIIGKYKNILKYPDELFKNLNFSPQMLAKEATQEMYKIFVQNKNLQEKYPENMMKGMAYFEVFYNNKLKEEKKAIEDYYTNYPDVKKSSKKSIQSLYSLTQAKKSMRESVGLTLNDNLDEALTRYMHMYDFLSQGVKSQNKLTPEEKKLKKESGKFKKYYGSFKKNIELKSEQRISQKKFNKELKKNKKKIKTALNNLNKISGGNNIIYKEVNKIFNSSLEILDNCKDTCERKELLTVIDSVDFNNSILKEVEKNIIVKKYNNDLSKISIDSFTDAQKETLTISSLSNKKQNEFKEIKLQKSVLNLANNNFEVNKILNNIEEQGYETPSIKMSFQDVKLMENWNKEDWANSWRGDLPSDKFADKAGNLIELSKNNIEDLKAQLARNEFENLIDLKNLNLNEELNENLEDIAKSVQESSGFNLDNWLNQDFSITLDNYTKIAAESIISELGSSIDQETINSIRNNANFENLTKLANLEYGTNLTPEEYAEYWESAKFTYNQPGQCGDLQGVCPSTSWGDVTRGVDLLSQVGSFEAASIAKDLGTDLQTVADSIALAATVGVSTDLEAAASGLGYDSFADAVAAYNEKYGTNYTTESAKEALGQ